MIDFGSLGNILDIAYKIGVFLFGCWMYMDRKNDKTHVRIDRLEKNLENHVDGLSDRVTRVETRLESQPTHHHLSEVYTEIRKVSQNVAMLQSSIAGIQATLDSVKELTARMDNFWRNK